MTEPEKLFEAISKRLETDGAVAGKLFGKPCLKITGKAFACFFEQCMVFKLGGTFHKEAMELDGSRLFDPSGANRPMKEWVQLPFDYSGKWENFAYHAFNYVKAG